MWRSFRKSVFYLIVRASSPFSYQRAFKYSTGTSKEQSFTVNYLINNFRFSPESAISVSKYTLFHTSQKPDSVVAFFRDYGFSDVQLGVIIRRQPKLLLSNPAKTFLPKIQFLQSKGASTSQLIRIVTSNSSFLLRSLENRLIPTYNLLKGFLKSDQRTIVTITRNASLLSRDSLQRCVSLLLDVGLRERSILVLLRDWPCLINCHIDRLRNKIDEIRELGIDPSRAAFVPAMYAKGLPKSTRESKVELYKKWGWTDEAIRKAFVKHPFCLLISEQKMEKNLNFFVNHMGWDPLVLASHPVLLSLSLKKRIIPRDSVLQYLLSRDLIRSARIISAYFITENTFLQKFVASFKDEAPQLLKLYEEKMNLSGMDDH